MMTMKKQTKRSKLNKVLRKMKIDAILPFKEKPSDEVKVGDADKIEASELFSLFTADIIKKDMEFVR